MYRLNLPCWYIDGYTIISKINNESFFNRKKGKMNENKIGLNLIFFNKKFE